MSLLADGFGPSDGPGVGPVVELFWAMATDDSVLAVLPFAVGSGLLAGFLAKRWLRFGFGWSVLAAWGFAGVVLAMFFSGRADRGGLDVSLVGSCLRSLDLRRFDAQAVLNSGLYLPLTFAGVMASRRVRLTAACTVTLVFVMEGLQSALGRGACDSADLVYNLVGVLVGVVAAGLVLLVWPDRDACGRRRRGKGRVEVVSHEVRGQEDQQWRVPVQSGGQQRAGRGDQ